MSDADPPIALPDDVRYSCLRCGRSCTDWTEIGVEADEAERLAELPLFNPRLSSSEDERRLPYEDGHLGLRLRTRPDGEDGVRCVFLDDDGLCAVHSAHGEEAKPYTCRSFPYMFIDSPDGIRAGLSFACTAVAHHHGTPVAEQQALVDEVRTMASHRERRGVGIRLAAGDVLPWTDWLALEKEIVRAFDAAPSVAAGLLAIERLVRERAALPAADETPSALLAMAALHWLLDLSGAPPLFRPPVPDLEPPADGDLLRRWIRHRLWRRDLLRGDEVMLALALLTVEAGLACAWAAEQPGGLVEAVAQVERGLALHADLIGRLTDEEAPATHGRRLLYAPRLVATMAAGIAIWESA